MQVNWPRQNLGISGCSPYSIMSSKPHSNQNKHTYTHTHTPYCYHYYASLLPPSEFPCSDTGQFSEHSQVPPWSTESLRFSASLSAMGACPTPAPGSLWCMGASGPQQHLSVNEKCKSQNRCARFGIPVRKNPQVSSTWFLRECALRNISLTWIYCMDEIRSHPLQQAIKNVSLFGCCEYFSQENAFQKCLLGAGGRLSTPW